MDAFTYGATTVVITKPCGITVTCEKTTNCRPQGATALGLDTVPADLEALKAQLAKLKELRFERVEYHVNSSEESRRANELLSQLRPGDI